MIKMLDTRSKRLFALMLALCLILALMPSGAFAAETISSAKVQDIIGANGEPTAF